MFWTLQVSGNGYAISLPFPFAQPLNTIFHLSHLYTEGANSFYPRVRKGKSLISQSRNLSQSLIKLLTLQEELVVSEVGKAVAGEKLDAVLNVAGGWAGGNASSAEFIKVSNQFYFVILTSIFVSFFYLSSLTFFLISNFPLSLHFQNCDLMWKQSVWSSTIAAAVTAKHGKPGGCLVLPGAQPATAGTPGTCTVSSG